MFLFFGCSSKEVFEPKNVAVEWKALKESDTKIIDKTAEIAELEDGRVLVKNQELNVTIAPDFRVIGKNGDYILSTNIDGDLYLHNIDTNTTKKLELKKTIAAASTDGDVVAVVFASGKLALYKLLSGKLLLKLEGGTSIALDARIVNPYFMNDLVLFLTLDGKIVIVNKTLKKRLRTIIVSANEYFNNVIYFDILQERLIVATGTKILSFGRSQKRVELEARNITHDKDHLYVATKQGDIIELSSDLDIKRKVHFPFAHFLGLKIYKGVLYALEKEGYIIKLSKDLLTYKIYEVDIPDDGYVYSGNDRFFVGDRVVFLDELSK
ncbi:Putative lipoprotein [hydrothermal vent metagenome]|uniref:Putative lipoprotein n=1 Tax=hydrothermal vent metagenome TaxID=652676 RepID=A0A1W1BA76_9ZZZZ